MSILNYTSDRLPNYQEQYRNLCNRLLLEQEIFYYHFLHIEGFNAAGNNNAGDFLQILDHNIIYKKFGYKWNYILGYITLLFQDDKLKRDYEGTYNTLNYLINAIYKEIDFYDGRISSKERLFTDIVLRREAVEDNFLKIVEYLWQTRKSIPNSRLSVGNHGLTKNRSKSGDSLSITQQLFIDAIAYGCTLNELEDNNFEGAKRLIYVPHNKINKERNK